MDHPSPIPTMVEHSHNLLIQMNSILEGVKSPIFCEDIFALDLSMIKSKLQDPEEGKGWSTTLCNEVETTYKRFLALKRAYPDKDIVPNKKVDAFWHQHILDTEKYQTDCAEVFGYFVHHYPYFGMNGPEDAQNLVNAFEETSSLFLSHFGEKYGGTKGRCRTGCKPMKCK